MKEFYDYDVLYPDLVWDLLDYFRLDSTSNKKSIKGFLDRNLDNGTNRYQPEILNRICQILCKHNKLSCLYYDERVFGLDSKYAFICKDEVFWKTNKEYFRNYYNSLVYGFEYIYNYYRNIVVPIVWKKNDIDYSLGSGFLFNHGIITAKHCITDTTNLSIKGFTGDELQSSHIFVSQNDGLDLAYIDVGHEVNSKIISGDAKIMDEVLVMGYPKIPAFTDFLTAEKATISSKAEVRLTPTRGTIAATGLNIHAKTELLLITAKIRGGNSGGPVIDNRGFVVGVACQTPKYGEDLGDYDDLGYGIAVPMECYKELNKELHVSDGFFRDYEWSED